MEKSERAEICKNLLVELQTIIIKALGKIPVQDGMEIYFNATCAITMNFLKNVVEKDSYEEAFDQIKKNTLAQLKFHNELEENNDPEKSKWQFELKEKKKKNQS